MGNEVNTTKSDGKILIEIPIDHPLQKSIDAVTKILITHAIERTVNKVKSTAEQLLDTDTEDIVFKVIEEAHDAIHETPKESDTELLVKENSATTPPLISEEEKKNAAKKIPLSENNKEIKEGKPTVATMPPKTDPPS